MIWYTILCMAGVMLAFEIARKLAFRKKYKTPKGTFLVRTWTLKDAHGNVVRTFENKREMLNWLLKTQQFYERNSKKK